MGWGFLGLALGELIFMAGLLVFWLLYELSQYRSNNAKKK